MLSSNSGAGQSVYHSVMPQSTATKLGANAALVWSDKLVLVLFAEQKHTHTQKARGRVIWCHKVGLNINQNIF